MADHVYRTYPKYNFAQCFIKYHNDVYYRRGIDSYRHGVFYIGRGYGYDADRRTGRLQAHKK